MSGTNFILRELDPRSRISALQNRVGQCAALYSEPVERWPVSTAPVLWITGLAGSGKTTLAGRLLRRLADAEQFPLLLDGDSVRETLDAAESRHDHSPARRLQRAWRLLRLAHCAACDSQPVIVATVSLMEDVQRANRRCHRHFGEVLIDAPMALLKKRRPQLYGDPAAHDQVVGCGQSAHYPPCPELTLRAPASCADEQRQLEQVLALWRSLDRSPS